MNTPEQVPTAADLVSRGLARVVESNKAGNPVRVTIDSIGQQLIYDTMKRNAARARAADEARRWASSAFTY
jgi:hypothetical protein